MDEIEEFGIEYCLYHHCDFGCQCVWPWLFSETEEIRDDLPSENEVLPLRPNRESTWAKDEKRGDRGKGIKPRTFRDMK